MNEDKQNSRITLFDGSYLEGTISNDGKSITVKESNLSKQKQTSNLISTTALNTAEDISVSLYGQDVKLSPIFKQVELFEGNRIKRIVVNSTYSVKSPKGSVILAFGELTFHPNGQLKTAYRLYNSKEENLINTPLGDVYSNTGIMDSAVEFYENGMFKKLLLSESRKKELLDPNKALFDFSLSINKEINYSFRAGNISIKYKNRLEFYENGALKGLVLAEPLGIVLNNRQFAIQEDLFFYQSGEIKSAIGLGSNKVQLNDLEINTYDLSVIKWKKNGKLDEISFYPVLYKTPIGKQYVSCFNNLDDNEKPLGFKFAEPVNIKQNSEEILISSALFDSKGNLQDYTKAELYDWKSDVKILAENVIWKNFKELTIKPIVITTPFGKLVCSGTISPHSNDNGEGANAVLAYPQTIKTEIGEMEVVRLAFSSTDSKKVKFYSAIITKDIKVKTKAGRFCLRGKTNIEWLSDKTPIMLHFRKYPKIRVSRGCSYYMKYVRWSGKKIWHFALAENSKVPTYSSSKGLILKRYAENTIIRVCEEGKKWSCQYKGYDQHGYMTMEYYKDTEQ